MTIQAHNPPEVMAATAMRRWSLVCILAVALRANPASADSLTDRVAAEFNHAHPKPQVTIVADDEIHLTTPIGPITVFLDRTRGECQKRPESCDATVKQLVSSTLATTGSADAMKFDPENVYSVVRPTNGIKAMQATIGSSAEALFVSQPYISGAVLIYALDTPKALRYVSASDLEHQGLTVDALDKLARAHVSRLSHLKLQQLQGAPGLWMAIANDGYGTSRLFDSKFWDEAEAKAGGPVAVALPTRDWLIAARLDDPESIARLRATAARIVAGEPTAVTSALVRRDGEGWSEVKP